jgi:stage II sporulation protein R
MGVHMRYLNLGNEFLHKSNFIRNQFYKGTIAFCLLVVVCFLFLLKAFQSDASEKKMQTDIASEIIRFHVIGNSNTTEDQELKLKVKSAVTDALKPKLENVKNKEEARQILKDNLVAMEVLADQIIKDNGFDYTAVASIEQGYFPLKVYGDLTLPPGEYEAVRIELGSAKGRNWWCVMYPPLCFVDATYSVVPKSSKDQLKHVLTDDEYNAVFSKGKVNIKVKFKILSWVKDLISE